MTEVGPFDPTAYAIVHAGDTHTYALKRDVS